MQRGSDLDTPSDGSFAATATATRLALLGVALAWIGLRIVAPNLGTSPLLARALETVDASPDVAYGRLVIHGWPGAAEDLRIGDIAAVKVAVRRFEARVLQANDALGRLEETVASHVEHVENGPTGLRVGGLLVVFPPPDDRELARLATIDEDASFSILTSYARLIGARLDEPPTLAELEESVARREMTRMHREIRDALEEKEMEVDEAAISFREEVVGAVHDAEGPFLRRGRGIAVEAVLAALLGALLRERIGPRRRPTDVALAAALAPVIALAVTYGLAGTRILPLHPALGLHPAYVALAFFVGWATPGILGLLSRFALAESAVEEGPPRAPRSIVFDASARLAQPPTLMPPPRVRPPEPPPRPVATRVEHAPFFPRNRYGSRGAPPSSGTPQ